MSESIDIVFVSNSSEYKLWEMTANAVRSAVRYASMPIGKVAIVEQCLWSKPQPIGKMLYYDFEFKYNKCLNLGFSICKSKYVAFCNNDLYFESNWARNAIRAMQKYGYLSVSPTNKHIFDGVREGYTIGKIVLGWCIIVDRRVFDKIGQFDEPVTFWYSDNVYVDQIQRAGVKHALVGNSRVRHLGSGSITLRKIDPRLRAKYQKQQEKLFIQYKKDVNTSAKVKTEPASNSSK